MTSNHASRFFVFLVFSYLSHHSGSRHTLFSDDRIRSEIRALVHLAFARRNRVWKSGGSSDIPGLNIAHGIGSTMVGYNGSNRDSSVLLLDILDSPHFIDIPNGY